MIETERLLLRELTPEDAGPLLTVLGDDEVMRFSSGVKDAIAITRWIETQITSYRTHGYGLWTVVERASSRAIGYCGLTRFPDIAGRLEVEIGYRLAKDAWGRGFATEAAIAVRDHALRSLGIRRLVSLIDPGNRASIRVAEKLGMRFEREVMFPEYDHPDCLYVIDG